MRALLACLLLAGTLSSPAFSHGGGLNAQGCHNDRKNGGYHCHRSAPRSQPARTQSNNLSSKLNGTDNRSQRRAFANCSEARAAGAAPVRRGDPGYGSHLDRDNDGIGCE
ncbi:excalibur calcium-binding domain-containing protein [Thalassovita mediterranea]|nr:excalibur calcium-binding domain-containing protein [Thalassovita mediterranea]